MLTMRAYPSKKGDDCAKGPRLTARRPPDNVHIHLSGGPRRGATVKSLPELLEPGHCVSNNLQKTARAVSRLYAEKMRPSGLTRAQFPMLGYLEAVGPLPMSDLAARLYMERTTLTRNLKPLEDAGLVERGASTGDARVKEVAITPRGRRKLKE